jgi:photosystem II stability/assembly factor-like uncharacterized protein
MVTKMKKLFLLLFSLCFISAYGQWTQVFPTPYRYVDVDFFNENIGFLVSLEEVYKSTDGGDTWQTVIIPNAKEYYSDIVVIDKDIIWNVSGGYLKSPGNGVVCKSEDGGNTWEIKLFDVALDFYELYFYDENTGFLCTNAPNYYSTNDGGETWTFSEEMPPNWINNFYFINEDTGWICGGGDYLYIAKTTDGGVSWETQLQDTMPEYMNIIDIEFVNELKGFASAGNRTFLATTDGGDTWEYIATAEDEGVLVGLPADYSIWDIEFIDENLGWITGGPC